MSEPIRDERSSGASSTPSSGLPAADLFAGPPAERSGFPLMAWVVAGLVVLLAIAGMLAESRRKAPVAAANVVQSLDPYAASLVLSGLNMSESSSLSGGKSTFLDGRVRNAGGRTVSSARLQVVFSNDEQLPPQVETLPLTLIRTHQPYIDTEPVSAAPLKPGDEREFRLIFENLGTNWNQQLPMIHVVKVE